MVRAPSEQRGGGVEGSEGTTVEGDRWVTIAQI
jgi:hypothetical protein